MHTFISFLPYNIYGCSFRFIFEIIAFVSISLLQQPPNDIAKNVYLEAHLWLLFRTKYFLKDFCSSATLTILNSKILFQSAKTLRYYRQGWKNIVVVAANGRKHFPFHPRYSIVFPSPTMDPFV